MRLLNERYAEYGNYRKWTPDKGEGAKGTLNWEFAKKIAEILGVGNSLIFNMTFSILLLKRIASWNLPVLLKG